MIMEDVDSFEDYPLKNENSMRAGYFSRDF